MIFVICSVMYTVHTHYQHWTCFRVSLVLLSLLKFTIQQKVTYLRRRLCRHSANLLKAQVKCCTQGGSQRMFPKHQTQIPAEQRNSWTQVILAELCHTALMANFLLDNRSEIAVFPTHKVICNEKSAISYYHFSLFYLFVTHFPTRASNYDSTTFDGRSTVIRSGIAV